MKNYHVCKRFAILAVLCCFFAGSFAVRGQAAGTVTYSVKGTIDYKKSYDCLACINKLRKSKGLSALTMSKALMGNAEQRGAELSCAYTHTRPNGKSPVSVNPALINAENIAYGQETADEAFITWKESRTHYKIMTTAAYRTVGIVCFEYDGQHCWVSLFSSRSAAPFKKTGEKSVRKKVAVAKKYLKKKNLFSMTYNVYMGRDTQIRLGLTGIPDQLFEGRIGNTLFGYKSSDPSVVQVNAKGYLHPLKCGQAKITVWAKADKKCRRTFTVRVEDEEDAYMDPDYSDD